MSALSGLSNTRSKNNTMVCRILASSQLGRPDPPELFFFTLRVFIFIIYFAHFSSAGLYVGCIDLHFLFCLAEKKERKKKGGKMSFGNSYICVCRAQNCWNNSPCHIWKSLWTKTSEKRKVSRGSNSPTEKVGKTWTLLHTSRKHHARKRKKRRLLVYFIPYFSSFLSSS